VKKGKISILDKPKGKFTIEEISVPEPKKGTFIAKQTMCGVCGTDVHMYWGWLPGVKYPIVLGHEILGKIDSMGEGVEQDFSGRPVKEGDQIYCVPGLNCGKCYFCSTLKEPTLCLNSTGLGFNPYPDKPRSFYGGYAEYIVMDHPWQTFVKINAKAEAAVFLEPLTIGIHTADIVRNYVGDTVVIQGAGAVGIACLIAAKESGGFKTIVVGAPESRLKFAKQCGADMVINIEEIKDPTKRAEYVREQTEGKYGADVVIEATGVPGSLVEGFEMLRRGGSYAIVGHFTDSGSVNINPFLHINNKQAKVFGVWGGEIAHFVKARPIIESGKYPIDKIVSHKLALDQCQNAMDAMSWGKKGYRLDGEEIRKLVIEGNRLAT
jgi:L-iditol 2-dehydrogenase